MGTTGKIPPPVAVVSAARAAGGAAGDQALLPGVIAGVRTAAVTIAAGGSRRFAPSAGERRLLLAIAGRGTVRAADGAGDEPFEPLALLIQPVAAGLTVTADATAAVVLLEIGWAQSAEELAGAAADAQLRVVRYADCPTYREAIKSPQTVNRTLVPADAGPLSVPRFAMGSVATRGPDAVAEHAHPMLEQLFFGLPGNDCVVTADGQAAAFGENALLYIPRGSRHGAQVAAGKQLHYAWLDFFPTAADMQWIRDMHRDNDDE